MGRRRSGVGARVVARHCGRGTADGAYEHTPAHRSPTVL